MQVVLANDFCGDEIQWEPHVFKTITMCIEVKVFDMDANEFCSGCGDSGIGE